MTNHKILILLLTAAAAVTGCTKGDDIETIQERAGKTAEAYYAHLVKGNYADFVAGMDGADSIPADYREQMEANAAMFMKQQTDDHKGISSITLSKCKADTARHTAEAFLLIKYNDKESEIVCVPMVERAGNWYMQ
ncbi:MAG: hypothetical protein ACI3Y5_07115 [Prevotella sp.]